MCKTVVPTAGGLLLTANSANNQKARTCSFDPFLTTLAFTPSTHSEQH